MLSKRPMFAMKHGMFPRTIPDHQPDVVKGLGFIARREDFNLAIGRLPKIRDTSLGLL